MRISDWSSDVCFSDLRDADAVIVGSYVPDGIAVGKMVQDNGRGVVAFYDIDTPVTLAQLEKGECDYLSPERIPGYDYYFSFSGGPVPSIIEQTYGAPVAEPPYCSVDADRYAPHGAPMRRSEGRPVG